MVSVKNNYGADKEKYDNQIESFRVKKVGEDKKKTREDRFKEKVKIWTSFYRENPHRFVKDFLNIRLHLFQAILLWAMMHHNFFMFIASRGLGA